MATKADFLGFEFAGQHSSDMGIIRVSDGDRFDEELTPEIKDVTVDVPGMHGEYFFGSTYGVKKFDIKIAYDRLTEEQFRKLRKLYGRQQIGELIFDERPYKKYMVKIENPIELSYVCFDEPKKVSTQIEGIKVDGSTTHTVVRATDGTERIYKGEGTINFVCCFPFAKSAFKQIPSGEEESDWVISSGILTAAQYQNFDSFDSVNSKFEIYNAGDLPTGFRLYIPAAQGNMVNAFTLTYAESSNTTYQDILAVNAITLKPNSKNGNNLIYDCGVLVDTSNQLIIGVSEFTQDSNQNRTYKTSGNIYNEFIDSGYFFKFQPNLAYTDGAELLITGDISNAEIFYDYLYF